MISDIPPFYELKGKTRFFGVSFFYLASAAILGFMVLWAIALLVYPFMVLFVWAACMLLFVMAGSYAFGYVNGRFGMGISGIFFTIGLAAAISFKLDNIPIYSPWMPFVQFWLMLPLPLLAHYRGHNSYMKAKAFLREMDSGLSGRGIF